MENLEIFKNKTIESVGKNTETPGIIWTCTDGTKIILNIDYWGGEINLEICVPKKINFIRGGGNSCLL